MNLLATLKIVLFIALLPNLYIHSVIAYSSVKNGKDHTSIIESKEFQMPQTPVEMPKYIKECPVIDSPIGKKIYSMNIAMAYKIPGTDKTGSHLLSIKEFESLQKIAQSASKDEFNNFMEIAQSLPTSEFVDCINNPQKRDIRVVSLVTVNLKY